MSNKIYILETEALHNRFIKTKILLRFK